MIAYHPNGLPFAYLLGNGLTYTQSLNSRQWPEVQETTFGGAPVQRYVYSYSPGGELTFLYGQAGAPTMRHSATTTCTGSLNRPGFSGDDSV